MGKAVRDSDPFVLDDQEAPKAPPKQKQPSARQVQDPFVLGDGDHGLIKKKLSGNVSDTTVGPGPSELLSAEDINKASKAYQDKALTVEDQDVLAKTDWGKQQGLVMPNDWKKSFVTAFNGPRTSELVNSVMNVLDANYPRTAPNTPQAQVRDQILQSVQKGDVPAIQKVRSSIIDAKQKEITQIKLDPQGPDKPSGIIGAPVYAASYTVKDLSDDQKRRVKTLEDEMGAARASLDAYVARSIVNSRDVQTQLRAELAPVNTKYADLTLSAEMIGGELEKTIGINKSIPNNKYQRTKAGLEAILANYQMDINDLIATGMKSKNPELVKQAEAKIKELSVIHARYNNLDNQFPDVGIYKTALYLGDILSETKPNRLFTTSNDVKEAAKVAEERTPGFLQSHGKFVDEVAKSEGDRVGIKSGMVPQGGLIGGIKTGTENIGWGGASFIAAPFGHTLDPKALEQIEAFQAEPQLQGTSASGATRTKIAYDKESKTYRESPNENYGQWNFNSTMYALGKGVPTLAEWIVLDHGIGFLAKGVGGAAVSGFNLVEEIAATTNALIGAKDLTAGYEAVQLSKNFEKAAGLYGTTYITSFDENRKLADNLIEDKSSMGEAKKNALANVLTLSTAGIFSMLDYSPTKAVEAALSKNAAPEVLRFLEKSSWETLSADETAKLLKEQIWPRAKAIVQAAGESAKAGVKLGAASVIDQKIKDLAGLIVNPKKAKGSSIGDNIHAFADQVLLMTVVGLPNMVRSGAFPVTSKDALYQAGLLAPQYIDRINDEAARGDLDQAQANKMIAIVKTMAEEVANASRTTNDKGLPLTVNQRRDVAVGNFRKRAGEMLSAKDTDIKSESVDTEESAKIAAIQSENKWNNVEEGVPFVTARDEETGKKLASVDDIDPQRIYTYEKEGATVTNTGAELFDYLINGEYEQVIKTEAPKPAEGEEKETAGAAQAGKKPQGDTGAPEKAVSGEQLVQAKAAIEKGIEAGKLKGVYVNLARSEPATFLKEIADQAHGILATGQKAEGEDAEIAARTQYGDDIVDAAMSLYPSAPAEAPATAVVRHAESTANVSRKPSTDETPLSKTGEKQADILGERLADQGYTDVLPSATARTQQTAERVVAKTGGQIIENPELSEQLKEWDQTGGETITAFAERIAAARDGIGELPPGTAVVAHGKVMAMLEALDRAKGDIPKAIEEFDKSKVYGNTETYFPKQKTKAYDEKGKTRQGDKTGGQGRPEAREERSGQPATRGEERPVYGDVGQTTEGPDGPREKEGDVLTQEGAVPEGTAPLRQTRINDLLDRTGAFNKLRKNDPSKASLLNEIRLEAKNLGLKVDYGKGFASIKDEKGNKVQRRSEETNTTPAKDFDITRYSDKTKNFVSYLVASALPLESLSIPGFDGRAMSEAQKQNALNDIRTGNMTNGAKAIYDSFEQMTKDGFVELIDPATRQRIGVPIDEYMKAVRQEVKPLTDAEIVELNSVLGEDVFGKIFDDIFAEQTEPGEESPTKEAATTERPPAGAAEPLPAETGEPEAGPGVGEPPAAPPVEPAVPEEKEPEPQVTGIRNIVVNQERMHRSLDPVIKEAATNFKDIWEKAKNLVKTGTVDPRSLVNSLAQEEKPKVSDIDNALILMDRVDLTNQRIALLQAIEKAQVAGDDAAKISLDQRLLDVEQKIVQNDEVSDRAGQETARSLSSRRMLATLDFTLAKMTADIRRLYPDKEVPHSLKQELADIERAHADLLRKYAEREEQQWKQEQAQRAFDAEKERVAKVKPEKKISLKGKELADKIRSLRPKSGGESLQSNIFGLPIAVYDTALVTIANLVEGGAKVGQAIQDTIAGIKFPTEKDRNDFIHYIHSFAEPDAPENVRYNLVMKIAEDAREQGATSLVKDNITPLRKMASSYIKEGVKSLNEVVKHIHKDLIGVLPDITERDIRDAFSGYGDVRLETSNELARQVKELQKQAVLISQVEDALSGLPPARRARGAVKNSKEVQRLKDRLEKTMKDNGVTWEEPPRDKAQQAQRALQSAKNRLKTQIENLSRQIEKGVPTAPKEATPWDAERLALKQERDRLQGILAETESATKLSDEMRLKRLENSLKKQIGQYDERIREGGGPLRAKGKAPTSPAIEALKAQRDALREINRKLQIDNNPKSTSQQIALEAYKDRVKNRIETLIRRAAEGDFEPQEKESILKDAEALKLDLALKSQESRFYTLKRNAEKANRGRLQKIFDKISAYKRFAVLSGLPSIGKIALAVTYRTIGTPAEELVGSAVRQLPGVRQVAAQAPREGGGFRLTSEGAALAEWVKAKTYKDWWEVLKKGRGEIDIRMGKHAAEKPELIEVFGRIHASLKNFSKRAEFARAYEARMEFARKKGFDTSDEIVQMTAAMDAYTDAGRSIFMQDNILTKEYFKLVKRLERTESGWLPRVGAFLLRFTMPVVKVPTNFIAETGTFAFGSLTGTAQIVYRAIQGELNQLSPQQADLILRSIKKGSVGLTLGIIGYMMPQLAGGYWQRGEDRDPDEVQPGELMFFGQRIPRWATHFPALEVMQVGATLRRAYDRRLEEKGESESRAVTGSIFDAAGGLLGEVPLFDQPSQIMNRIKYGEWDKIVGDEAKSLSPQLLQNIATWTDREDGETVKRAPEDWWDQLKTGIPWLREQVPRK